MRARKAIVLGLVAFLLALVVVLPASWMKGALPEGVACGSWAGSVWRGQCRELSLSDGGKVVLKLSSLRWKLRPSSLLRLRVGADFQSDWATGRATGRVAVTPAGTIQLREMAANSVLDSTALPALPAGWSGRIDLRQGEFNWQSGELGRLGGELVISELTDRRGGSLGGYRLDLPASDTPPFVAQLRDTGGPLEVEAQLSFANDLSWTLEGRMRQRTPDAQLGQRLDLLSGADAQGWRRLGAAGDFN
jgi:hypothetical protein